MDSRSAAPGDRCNWADQEEPGDCAAESDCGDDHEGPIEVAGSLEDETGDGRSHDTSQITDEILESGPATRSDRTGEGLGDGPEIGGDHTEEDDAEDESDGAVDGIAEASETDEEAT